MCICRKLPKPSAFHPTGIDPEVWVICKNVQCCSLLHALAEGIGNLQGQMMYLPHRPWQGRPEHRQRCAGLPTGLTGRALLVPRGAS